jgi:hypothetical protein
MENRWKISNCVSLYPHDEWTMITMELMMGCALLLSFPIILSVAAGWTIASPVGPGKTPPRYQFDRTAATAAKYKIRIMTSVRALY